MLSTAVTGNPLRSATDTQANDRRVSEFRLDTQHRTAMFNGATLALTPIEFSTIDYLLERRGIVVGKSDLLEVLMVAFEFDKSEIKSVDVLVARLRKKFASVGLAHLIVTVWGMGYMVQQASDLVVVRLPASGGTEIVGTPLTRELLAGFRTEAERGVRAARRRGVPVVGKPESETDDPTA